MGRTLLGVMGAVVRQSAKFSLDAKFAICELSRMRQLADYREQHALTLQQLAGAIGTSPGYLHDIEKGRRKPSPRMALSIERKTGLSRHDLLPDVFGPAPIAKPQSEKAA